MRVVFIQYGQDISCARLMVESCKRFGYEVVQLSDMDAPKVEGVDDVIRRPMNEPHMLFRCRFLTEIDPPYVMLDTDMLVARDIQHGFGTDVALTWRPKHTVHVKALNEYIPMPYNGGIVFVSNQGFVRDCLTAMESMPPILQEWYGDQIALRDVAMSGRYQVRELRDQTWNFVPDYLDHDIPDVRVYHFKGRRKFRMAGWFEQMKERA